MTLRRSTTRIPTLSVHHRRASRIAPRLAPALERQHVPSRTCTGSIRTQVSAYAVRPQATTNIARPRPRRLHTAMKRLPDKQVGLRTRTRRQPIARARLHGTAPRLSNAPASAAGRRAHRPPAAGAHPARTRTASPSARISRRLSRAISVCAPCRVVGSGAQPRGTPICVSSRTPSWRARAAHDRASADVHRSTRDAVYRYNLAHSAAS